MIRSFFHLIRYCRPYRRFYIVGTLALILVDLLDTFTPKLTQWVIDHLVAAGEGTRASNPLVDLCPPDWFGPDAAAGGMWVYGLLLVVLVGATGFFRYLMSMSFARAGVQLIHDLRGRFFAHLQRLDGTYHDRTKVGDHMSRATNDTDACRMFFGIGLLLLLDTGFYFIMVPAYMLSISAKLMFASLATLPLIPLIVAKLETTVESRFEKVQAQFSTLSERAQESYSGAKVIKSFAREEAEVQAFGKLSREYLKKSLSFARILSLEMPLLSLLVGFADLVVVLYGGSLVIRGEISVGEFAAFFQYLLRLSWPMIGLGWTIMLFQRARVSMGRIEEVMAIEPGIREPSDPVVPEDQGGGLEIRGLTFAYGEDTPPVVRDLDIVVAPGRTLGIVGTVGSGKSTILSLIPRLYDPPDGTVFLDGVDIRRIPLETLRTRIGVVPQETFLFGESVRKNIALGVPDGPADDEWIRRCASLALISDEIEALPNQYETLLGERGVNLSGGQKQRVAIARALARDSAVLLLDDCLSSVDTQTESAILENLRRVRKDRTTVVVSHRVSTVMDLDEIVVFAEGHIVERGTHVELIARDGVYADLHERQRIEAEEGDD